MLRASKFMAPVAATGCGQPASLGSVRRGRPCCSLFRTRCSRSRLRYLRSICKRVRMGIEPNTAPRLGPLDLLAAGLDRYRSDGRALWAYYASSIPFAVLLVAALAQTLNTRVEHLRWLSAALAAGYLLRLWGAS